MKINQLNHTALPVQNLEKSCQFYQNVLGLAPIARPAFNFPGAWVGMGDQQELHLISKGTIFEVPPLDRHFAFRVDDIHAFAAHLQEQQIEFVGPKCRPDRALQIVLRDPDGHVIELCTKPGIAPD